MEFQEEGLVKLDETALCELASQCLNLRIDPKIKKEDMIKGILDAEASLKEHARRQNEQAAKALASQDDPLVRVTFQHIESPGSDLPFTWGPSAKQAQSWHLYDGKEYDLPVSVIQHLNSRTVPDPRYQLTQSGEIAGVQMGVRNRFACLPNMKKLMDMVKAAVSTPQPKTKKKE